LHKSHIDRKNNKLIISKKKTMQLKSEKRRDVPMERIIAYISLRYGKDLSVFNTEFLSQSINVRMEVNHINSLEAYYELLLRHEQEIFIFMTSLFVGYSEFFREALSWHLLEKHVVPDIISRKKQGQVIRVWSVGCADGKEPYSLLMLADELLKDDNKNIRLQIFATDMVEEGLEKGRKGIYTKHDLRHVTMQRVENYFSTQEDYYIFNENLKKQITFVRYDILDELTFNPPESIYGGFDLIFCRNLLIYYNQEAQRLILNKLLKALAPKGYVVTGEAEMLTVENIGRVDPIMVTGAVFRKTRH
jgi:chemotaxis protein methyltransferase CheR